MSQLSFNDVTALWKADKRRWVKPSTYAVGGIEPEQLSEESIQRFADVHFFCKYYCNLI